MARAIHLGLLLGLVSMPLAARSASADEVLKKSGDVPDDGLNHFRVPFDVPAGTAEIEVRHDDLSEENILDWGLESPSGFRGWGGGNEEPAIVGEAAASRSYLTGPIEPGTWNVVVGKAKIEQTPAQYELEIVLRDAPTLAPQPERMPYEAAAPLSTEARWYAGDFHVHSRDSGDARPSLDEIAAFARERGLDFVEISDHNTVSHLDFFVDAQSRHPDLLFLPGMEYTTYSGHANAVGATQWVDDKIGQPGVTIGGAAEAFAAQGALFSINHPVLSLGDACIGCAWEHDLPPEHIGAVEIATGGLQPVGQLFTPKAIEFWDALCATGRHVAAIGGSDDHRAGEDLEGFQSPIGDPTTLVFAEGLSAAALLDGIRKGRTVVKLQGPSDPMVELSSSVAADGDTVSTETTTLRAVITDGGGTTVRFVRNGEPQEEISVDGDPFTAEAAATPPSSGEDRWRVEVLVDGKPRTVTSHLWLRSAQHGDPPGAGGGDSAAALGDSTAGGCGCSVPGPAGRRPPALALLVLAASAATRRRRSRACRRATA